MASSTTQMRMFFLVVCHLQNYNFCYYQDKQYKTLTYHVNHITSWLIFDIIISLLLILLVLVYYVVYVISRWLTLLMYRNIGKIIIFFQHHNLTHLTETLYIYYICYTIHVTSIHVKCIRSIAFYAFCNLDMENHWWQFKTC